MLNQQSFTGNMCIGKAGLAAGTTTTLTSANAITYSINSVAYAKAITSNEATPTTDIVTGAAFVAIPVGSGAVFTIGRDSAGALKVAQSKIVVLDSDEDFPAAPPQLARLPNSYTTIGYVSVKVGTSGAAWTFGASNLAGPPTDVDIDYQDVVFARSTPWAPT
ncbi:MAG: hypothetical protein IPN69_08495 [Acidobacteria bacterium]|nr:hypothetical protein [Acidobacteriota bacterium]